MTAIALRAGVDRVDWGVETWAKLIGGLTAAAMTVAGALYAVHRRMKADGRDDSDDRLLGRAKTTIFEQMEGAVRRLQGEVDRYQTQLDRVLNEQVRLRDELTQANRRILEIELDRNALRKIVREMSSEILALKRGTIGLRDLRDTGVYETHLHS